ncbi:hypothetical protein J6590_011646 [Homalodisca vitripennis]|nr:hypothetical protein J6590_011645 [Homalodisca vitripennis]KAG8269017.1 hypothetical protein J6590_011646 [Homalodisca vitripennis]
MEMTKELTHNNIRIFPDEAELPSARSLSEVRHGVRLALIRSRSHYSILYFFQYYTIVNKVRFLYGEPVRRIPQHNISETQYSQLN